MDFLLVRFYILVLKTNEKRKNGYIMFFFLLFFFFLEKNTDLKNSFITFVAQASDDFGFINTGKQTQKEPYSFEASEKSYEK